MKVNDKRNNGEPRPERFAYTSPAQIVWVHKTEAHFAAEGASAAKQAAEHEAGEAQPAPNA
ncbi:MAG TPA: hypothetical protein VFD32_18170 [Dehalococcoidia bacterium]|nr:hypothetical protein [Dehalococcoidia bacterium]